MSAPLVPHVAATDVCRGCGTTSDNHPSYCPHQDDEPRGCPRGCPEDDCYCAEPTYTDPHDVCGGCGEHIDECCCGED